MNIVKYKEEVLIKLETNEFDEEKSKIYLLLKKQQAENY